MTCNKCNSNRILGIGGDYKNLGEMDIKHLGVKVDGYLPDIGPFGSEMDLKVCLDCGKVQGEFPITDDAITTALDDMGMSYKSPTLNVADDEDDDDAYSELDKLIANL